MNEDEIEKLLDALAPVLVRESKYAYTCGLQNQPGPISLEGARNLVRDALATVDLPHWKTAED